MLIILIRSLHIVYMYQIVTLYPLCVHKYCKSITWYKMQACFLLLDSVAVFSIHQNAIKASNRLFSVSVPSS